MGSHAGDVFAWGGGTTYQLANRPRDVENPHDAREEPDDELFPYLVSSKALQHRFVLMADGGAQHSVILAWSDDDSAPDVVRPNEQEQSAEEAASIPLEPEEDDRPKEVIVVETRADFWRVQIESVYRRRNPIKLGNVPALLQKYEGQEAVLYAKVCKTYDLDPTKFYADPSAWESEEGDIKDDGTTGNQVQEEVAVAPPKGDFATGAIFEGVLFPNADMGAIAPGTNIFASASDQDRSATASVPDGVFVFGASDVLDGDSTEDDPQSQEPRAAKKNGLRPTVRRV